jgi:hypothetical protein
VEGKKKWGAGKGIGGFKSEDTGRFLFLQNNIPNLYPEQKI